MSMVTVNGNRVKLAVHVYALLFMDETQTKSQKPRRRRFSFQSFLLSFFFFLLASLPSRKREKLISIAPKTNNSSSNSSLITSFSSLSVKLRYNHTHQLLINVTQCFKQFFFLKWIQMENERKGFVMSLCLSSFKWQKGEKMFYFRINISV